VEKELYKTISQIINHPMAQVCKHWSAIQILQAMENMGFKLNESLVGAIVNADDEKANKILHTL